MLTLAYALNFLDRQIINILAESIKRDLQISDTQLGLLTGTAFGMFYSILGIPIARLADRTHRVRILSAALMVWSVFTGLCGLAASFTQLFIARLGVGIGEAGGTPASQSLLSDYFPASRRATALAIFSMGLPIGTALGFVVGGYLDALVGWRHALAIAAIPGVLLALVILWFLREPHRGAADGIDGTAMERPPFGPAIRELLRKRGLLYPVIGGSCAIFVNYVCNAWLPAFYIRLHGMDVGQAGLWIGLCVMTGGSVGVLGGGILVDRCRPKMHSAEVIVPAVTTVIALIALFGVLLAETTRTAIVWMFVFYTFITAWMGPTNAVVQRTAPIRSRSLATGLQLLIGNIVSLAVGPALVGWLSDTFGRSHGVEGLRLALLCVPAAGLIGAGFYIAARRHLQAAPATA